MQLIGGETVDDLQMIRNDPVVSEIVGQIPSRTSFHNYLSSFVDETEESRRGPGKSVVLTPNEYLKGFGEVTRHYLSAVPLFSEMDTVTLDQDATFIPSGVSGALYNYKSEKSFQALNTYCPEYDMTICSEFRDGNVTPGYRQLEQLKACEWRKVSPDSRQECAVIPFAPNSLSCSKKGTEYRFIALREVFCEDSESVSAQRFLFEQDVVPPLHPTLMNGKVYKVFALVTNNIELPPEEIVRWYHARCGKSEEVHRILKNELAGGHVVTKALGANAAWWQIVLLSANLQSLIKRCCLPKMYHSAPPKQLRFLLFSVVARISRHARKCLIVIYHSAAASLLKGARVRLAELPLQLE